MSESPGGDETPGELVLVSTPIGNLGDLSPRAAATLSAADIVCCEDTRHTGTMLKRLGITARRLLSLHAHNEGSRLPMLLDELASGHVVAVVSDAGTPAVSDPGGRLVAAAAEAGVRVSAVPGPSAVLAALVVSGMKIERWHFEGFLPRKGGERRTRLAEIASAPCPSVCYESPPRLAATLADLAQSCGPERRVAVCRELTKLHEEVRRSTLAEAVSHFAVTAARGEFVLVVEGTGASRRPAEAPNGDALAAAVDEQVASGASRRDAVREVAERLGVARSTVYEAALRSAESPGAGVRDR
ncbi:MAG TPA: 16S rRNA (cytidine(1402)-2'-O)-methyltransferase [Acidimicrobiales bacterium]|nr:16S rRNA (cytidine(1402)-2'-O)-methyltransferase [Acidimicrobiales bacterium]